MNDLKARWILSTQPSMTYDQALESALQKDSTLELMSPTDWTWASLTTSRRLAYSTCEALNHLHKLNRTDHLKSVSTIFSYNKGKVTEERVFMINKNVPDYRVLRECRELLRTELVAKSVWYQLMSDLEVIEA